MTTTGTGKELADLLAATCAGCDDVQEARPKRAENCVPRLHICVQVRFRAALWKKAERPILCGSRRQVGLQLRHVHQHRADKSRREHARHPAPGAVPYELLAHYGQALLFLGAEVGGDLRGVVCA